MSVNIPLTGAGGTTATVAADAIGGEQYQYMKLANGVAGSSVVQSVLTTTPAAADPGAVTRPIGSTAHVQAVVLTAGTSATFQYMQSIPFSSGNLARTTVNTSADASIVAANASRKALVIANLTTAQVIGVGFSTGAVTTGRANVNAYIPANSQIRFGLGGDFPLFLGPMRGIIVSSTTTSGGVSVSEFT